MWIINNLFFLIKYKLAHIKTYLETSGLENFQKYIWFFRSPLGVAPYVKSAALVIGPGTIRYNALKRT